MKLDFKNWVINEGDIFGFDRGREKEYFHTTSGITGKCFDPINSDMVLEELARHPLGVKNPIWSESTKVEWGEGPGSVKIDISPWGSFKAILKRRLDDLEGNPVWITEKVIPFKEFLPKPDWTPPNPHNPSLVMRLYKLERVYKIEKSVLFQKRCLEMARPNISPRKFAEARKALNRRFKQMRLERKYPDESGLAEYGLEGQ